MTPRKCIFSLALALCLIWQGCATTEQIAAIDQTIQKIRPTVRPFVAALMQLGIEYGAKKSGTDIVKLNADINAIADKINRGSTLAASTAGNVMTPTQFCQLMKVEDDQVTDALQALVPIYTLYYNEWKKDPDNLKIFAYSQCVLDGLSLLSESLTEATK